MAKWFIRPIFLEPAAQILHMSAVTGLLNSVILWIPNLIVALVILLIGMLLADIVGPMVWGAVAQSRRGDPDLLAKLAEYGIMALP